MSIVKELKIVRIERSVANNFVIKHHYSGKICNNSKIHFGVIYNNRLYGVLSYGSPMDKNKVISLIEGTKWDEMLELNRMAFSNALPKNSESYAIGFTLRELKKHNRQLKWVLSFADGVQCGDGTIYRASNFILTQIKKNTSILKNIYTGEIKTKLSLDISNIKTDNFRKMDGYMFRYIYIYDKRDLKKLNCEIIPFSKIAELKCGMYLGKKRAYEP